MGESIHFSVDSTKLTDLTWESHGDGSGLGELEVTFPRGATYVYHGVPLWAALEVAGSDSPGKAFHKVIEKGAFPYERKSA